MAFATTRSVRPVSAARASAPRVRLSAPVVSRGRFIVRAEPAQTQVESAVQDAEKACEGGTAGECAAAWDNVEEISAAIAHKKANDAANNANDPLEIYCNDNPDADECRVYDD